SLYIGATNDVFLRPELRPRMGMAHFLMTCAMEQIDSSLGASRIRTWHLGNRPASIDGFPLVGRIWQDNAWLLTGTYRDGFHCSPVLADYMAKVLTGGSATLGHDYFVPLRPLIATSSRAEAIDEMTLHHVSGAYEYSARLPGF